MAISVYKMYNYLPAREVGNQMNVGFHIISLYCSMSPRFSPRNCLAEEEENKLAKARKTRKWPGTLGLKQFGPGKLRIKNVWSQNIFIDFIDQA